MAALTQSPGLRAFNVFSYITLRAVLAALTALAISFIVGPAMIRKLTPTRSARRCATTARRAHLVKAGTPTMGGALILVSIAITTCCGRTSPTASSGSCCCVTLGFGDRLGRRLPQGRASQPEGSVGARQVLLAVGDRGRRGRGYLAYSAKLPQQTELIVPFFKTIADPLGAVGFVVLGYFVIVGTRNAVNLTDGLDGLAIMPTVMVGAALGVFAYVAGQRGVLEVSRLPATSRARASSTVFCGALAGAGLGFLWFNAYPAEVFMGDVGALALGRRARHGRGHRAAGDRAVHHGRRVRGGDAVGDASRWRRFKLTGKRIFRMAPLHHHYELKGWKENQVVVRFWIITMMLVLFGLSTLKLR